MSVTGHLVFDPASLSESSNVGAHIRAGDDGTVIGHVSDALKVSLTNASIVVTATDLDIRDLSAASDSVSSWLKDGSGNAITSTSGALDVNIKSPISVTVDLNGIYNVGTNPTPDNVGIIAFARSATPGLSDQTFKPTGGAASSDAVTAANVQALDVNAFGMGYNGTSWDRLQVDGSKNLKVSVQNSITTTDAALANVAGANAALSVGTSSISAVASILANRKYLYTFNNGSKAMYLGFGTVTAANGFPMYAGQAYEFRAGAAIDMKVISTAASQDLRTLELS